MKYFAQIKNIRLLLSGIVLGGLLVACTEKIDEEYVRTAQEPTIWEFLTDIKYNKHVDLFTEYVSLLQQVPVSTRSSSTVAQLLSARGHYTCFAPNNQAIHDYLQELKDKDIIDEASWSGFRTDKTLDSIRRIIVYNSIIDGSNNEKVLEMGDIIAKGEHEEFLTPNLNNRKLYKITIDGEIYMNGVARIDPDRRDEKALNGRVHEVHAVIAPSNDTMADVFGQIVAERKKGFMVMARLILACGLEDTLSKTQDDVWEDLVLSEQVKDLEKHPTEQVGSIPLHRKYGFTIFAEPDALWEELMGKPYDQISAEDVQAKLIELGAYPNASQDNDYTNENNLLNQFVTYHILPEKLVKGRLVIHYNERGYYWKTSGTNFTIPVYEYYTTMGKRRLLKIYQSAESALEDPNPADYNAGIYLNRFPVLHNARGIDSNEEDPDYNNYHETGQFKDPGSAYAFYADENKGIRVKMEEDGSAAYQNLTNSCIYPLDRFLIYTENVQNRLAGERIRIDMAAMFPEMINNDIRRPTENYPEGTTQTKGFPVDADYRYLANVEMENGTGFYYFTGHDRGWSNYQMDEFNIIGNYEFTMTLPPVPKKGTYEIRFGVSCGSPYRSMCQVYFGTNKSYLPAKNIPMDLRIGFVYHHFRSGNQGSNFGYAKTSDYSGEADLTMEEQDEITKSLRARGFMKGPKYYHIGNGTDAALANTAEHVTRRIMVTEELDPDKTYYIRFKNVLGDKELQFFMDFFEFVSKEVYDNPVEPEDIW